MPTVTTPPALPALTGGVWRDGPACPAVLPADLLEHRHDDAKRADALAYLVDDLEPDPQEAFDGRQGHAYAPIAVFTLLAAGDLGNGRERATLPDNPVNPDDASYAEGFEALEKLPGVIASADGPDWQYVEQDKEE